MTYRDYISLTGQRFDFTANDKELFFANQKALIPDPDGEVDITTAKKALVNEIANILPIANVSEGGYSVSWNMEAIRLWYKLTCAELGIVPIGETPTAKNRSDIW